MGPAGAPGGRIPTGQRTARDVVYRHVFVGELSESRNPEPMDKAALAASGSPKFRYVKSVHKRVMCTFVREYGTIGGLSLLDILLR